MLVLLPLSILSAVCAVCTSSSQLKSLDPFCAQKELAFTQSLQAITALASYVLDISSSNVTLTDASDHFSALFHVCFAALTSEIKQRKTK